MNEVTRILNAISRKDSQAVGELFPAVYEELRRVAAAKMAHETPGHTLQPTSLVHEAWLRISADGGDKTWQNRAHFFGAAAEAMRRILIDKARRRQAQRHGGGQQRMDIQDVDVAAPIQDEELLSVHEALNKFAVGNEQKAELVKLRYFVGMTLEEAAEALDISLTTAKRWWTYSRAWLRAEMDRK